MTTKACGYLRMSSADSARSQVMLGCSTHGQSGLDLNHTSACGPRQCVLQPTAGAVACVSCTSDLVVLDELLLQPVLKNLDVLLQPDSFFLRTEDATHVRSRLTQLIFELIHLLL